MMSEYSDFILVNRNTLGPWIFVGCHRMSENSGVGLHKFHCTNNNVNVNNYMYEEQSISKPHTTGIHSKQKYDIGLWMPRK